MIGITMMGVTRISNFNIGSILLHPDLSGPSGTIEERLFLVRISQMVFIVVQTVIYRRLIERGSAIS